MIILIEIILLLILLILSAFFSSSETAFFSLNSLDIQKIRLKHKHSAELIEAQLGAPTRLLSTILIGNTLVNVFASALGFLLLTHLNVPHAAWVAIPIMTMLLLVFGEVLPKRIASAHATDISRFYSRPLIILTILFKPLRLAMESISRKVSPSIGQHPRKSLSEDEFLTVIEVGEEEGILNEEERTMVDSIIRLEETQASDIMTPRVDLIGIDLDDPLDEQINTIRNCRFHFLPLYDESLDHIKGFLDVPRFLLANDNNIQASTIKPYFVPENVPLDALLTDFQINRRRIAVVSDEFGGTAGLVTRGDILEEIADDVDNEFGEKADSIQQIDELKWLISGSTSLEDINYELDLDLEADGSDRISGWVTAQTENIPRVGETAIAQGCKVTVQRVRRQRILLVMLEKTSDREQNLHDKGNPT